MSRTIRELCRLLNSLIFPRLSGTCSRPERLKLLYRVPPHFLLSSVILFNIYKKSAMENAEENEAGEVLVKPKILTASERLAAKKRFRTQRRLSTMKNKVLRNAQWATLKKEKRKVKSFYSMSRIFYLNYNEFLNRLKKKVKSSEKRKLKL